MTTDRGYPWLKMYPTWLDDPRYMRLSDGSKARSIEFYLLAGRADAGGLLVIGNDVATVDDLAFAVRQSVEAVAAQVEELIKSGLLAKTEDGFIITRFQEEQGPSQTDKRDDWRKRQQRKREKASGKQVPAKAEALIEELSEEEAVALEGVLALEVTRESRVTIGDVTVTTPTLSPSAAATTLLEKLETNGGLFIWPGDAEREGVSVELSQDRGMRQVQGMMPFVFTFLDTETTSEHEGYFYPALSELRKLEEFFSKFPRKEVTEDGLTYQKVEFDKQLYSEAIEFYFWKWHATGRGKFDTGEILDLFGKGESHISAEINRHPEYYRDCGAVRLVADVTRQAVPEELYPDIYELIGSRSNHVREYLTACWVKWRSKGYRQNDFSVWLFEWFKNGVDLEAPRQVEYSTR